jgi:hypothetical protein
MLADNIKRYNASSFFKLINVEQYIASGHKIPPQIHSVPALMFKDTKNVIFGKQVFDYLLLPSKGFLLNLPSSSPADKITNEQPSEKFKEPCSFSLSSGISSGDSFSFIKDTPEGDVQKGYKWCDLGEKISIPTPEDATLNLEKDEKSKKPMIDLATLRSQRDLDIQQTSPAIAQLPPQIPIG